MKTINHIILESDSWLLCEFVLFSLYQYWHFLFSVSMLFKTWEKTEYSSVFHIFKLSLWRRTKKKLRLWPSPISTNKWNPNPWILQDLECFLFYKMLQWYKYFCQILNFWRRNISHTPLFCRQYLTLGFYIIGLTMFLMDKWKMKLLLIEQSLFYC